MKVILISFPTLPVCQNLMYLAYIALRDKGIYVKTIGAEDAEVDYNITNDNYLIRTPEKSGMTFKGVLELPLKIFKILYIINKEKPDIVHFTHKHIWNYVVIKLIRLFNKKIKIVHSLHDPVGHEGDSVKNGVIMYNSKIIHMADALVVHSENALKQLRENYDFGTKVFIARYSQSLWKAFTEKK